VLDLDHTLLDFSSRGQSVTEGMRRPFVDDFLAAVSDSANWHLLSE
jgi:hypothetical protein